MPSNVPVPAAQYLRMSTDDQQYSIANQRFRIAQYAETNGFSIVRTYEDPGKSGLIIKHRKGLSALLRDVLSGEANFRAILVYDVSRWGRFQNPDEAAHYEFLCASAGIPLHYCAEQFSNDGTASSSIVKALKRSMAAEFSRELGEKVFRGKTRLCQMGFWMGGPAGYGYRRRIVSPEGKPGRILKEGQQKGLKTDRITLVLGPRKELETVRMIFALSAEGRSCTQIARELDRKGKLINGRPWSNVTVEHLLNNPKYIGSNIFNRHTQRLQGSLKKVEPQYWIVTPGVFPPIVAPHTFERAQATLKKIRDSHWSAEKILPIVRRVLQRHGMLSEDLILNARGAPSSATIHRFFGRYQDLYKLLNYKAERRHVERLERARRSAKLRRLLETQLMSLFPGRIKISRTWRGARSTLRVDERFMVSVLFCRHEKPLRKANRGDNERGPKLIPGPCWGGKPAPAEREYITLLCLMSKEFDRCLDYYVVDQMGDRAYIRLRRNGEFLRLATRLQRLQDFYATVTKLWEHRRTNARNAA